MIYKLPLTSADAHYRFSVDLGGSTFILVLDWNQRDEAWYLSLELPDGTQLMDGHKVVLGWPMFRRVADERRPQGELIFIDTTKASVEPGRNDLGGRVVGLWYDLEDLTELVQG